MSTIGMNPPGQQSTDARRHARFDVVAGQRYRLGIRASDEPGRESPRGLIAKLEFLDASGRIIEGAAEGSIQTDRHGPVVYLPTAPAGQAGSRLSENLFVAPAGACHLRLQVRNWKCSPDVAIHSPVELVDAREPALATYDFPVQASKPYALHMALRGAVHHSRAAILAVEFFDAANDVISGPYDGFIRSPRFGTFRYMRATVDGVSVRVPLHAPPGAVRVRLSVYPWQLAMDKLETVGEPTLAQDIPEGLDPSEWSLLPTREWSSPQSLGEGCDGLLHLALDCIGIERQQGPAPAVLVGFVDSTGAPVSMPGDSTASPPSIAVDSPNVVGRRGGFFYCPPGATSVRFMLAPTDAYSVLVRGAIEVQHVPANLLPAQRLLPLGPAQTVALRQAISSLWSSRVELEGFAVDADHRALRVELTLLDAAAKPVSPKGVLLESAHATATIKGNVLTVTPHSMASGTQGVVRFASSFRILPPRGATTLSLQIVNPRAQGLAVASEITPYDGIAGDRVVPESIPEILAMDERFPEKVLRLGEIYLERHGREPRVMTHLIDVYRRFGEMNKLESVARKALAARGPDLSKLHTKARHALAMLQELDLHWLPTAGLGAALHNPPSAAPGLRVAHLFKTTVPVENTGGAIRCLNIVNFQRKMGMQPLVVTPLGYPDAGGTGRPWERESIDGVPYFRLNGVGRHALRGVVTTTHLEFTALLTARLLGEHGIDIVQASSGYRGYEQALVGLAVSRALNVPFVYEVRSYHEHTWRGMTDWLLEADHTKRRIAQENRCMQEADAVVTICETMKHGLVERGIPAEKVFVVPNSVDLEKFHEAAPDAELRARLGLGSDVVAGYISNVSEREGHDVLLQAVAHARASGVGMKCLVVGTGPRLARLRTLAAQLGIAEHVVFTGEVAHEQVPAYYALIDIFVVPRVGDFASDFVTPMKPFEAMAMRRPLIVSDRPALLEIVGMDGQRGLVFRAGDHVDLAARLVELAQSPARREALAGEGRRWIEGERSWDRTIHIYEQVYAHAKHAAAVRLQRTGPNC